MLATPASANDDDDGHRGFVSCVRIVISHMEARMNRCFRKGAEM